MEGRTVYKDPNDLPSSRVYAPSAWRDQVAELNPLDNPEGWICFEADRFVLSKHPDTGRSSEEGFAFPLPNIGQCPLCFNHAPKSMACGQCRSVFYCSKDCQKKHWKQSHRESCAANPKLYNINTNLNMFRGLKEAVPDAFEGYEFLLIKPTDRFPDDGLVHVCAQVLESADDIMEIAEFGTKQLQPLWAAGNSRKSPIGKKIVKKYGWTSGVYTVEVMEGYRLAENMFAYMVLSDDAFTIPEGSPNQKDSYYGASVFPSVVQAGKQVRGNLVVYKTLLKNKQWRAPEQHISPLVNFMLGDDSNLQFEFEMYPICKAEIAHMLVERRRALEENGYSRRMWRHAIRQKERQVEQPETL